MSVIIVGAGAFSREISAWLMRCQTITAGYLDDNLAEGYQSGLYKVLGSIDDYPVSFEDRFLIGIADPKNRENAAIRLRKRGARFSTMGSECIASTRTEWGTGTIVCPYGVISENAKLGEHVHVNLHATIGHDTVIGDYCTISCHADITGHVTLGKRVFVGSHAVILPHVKVGDDAIIGAGSVVVNDVEEGATVYAQPARRL